MHTYNNMTFAIMLITMGMQMHPHPLRMQLPIGFGGSYEDYWPAYDAYSRYRYPQYRHPHYSQYRYPQYQYPRYPLRDTLSHKLDMVRHELRIPSNLPISEAISRANDIMGMENSGTLTRQLDRLMEQLGS